MTPTLAIVSRNLLDRLKIESAATAAGFVPAAWDPSLEADLVVVDLEDPRAADAISAAASGGVRCVAYGPHVRVDLLEAATATGATSMPRSRFFGDIGGTLRSAANG